MTEVHDGAEEVAEPLPEAGWQRLDPRMMLVHPVREVLRFLPVLLGLFVAGTASGGGGPWQYLFVLVPVALGLMRYLTTRFRIANGRVELSRGLLNRHVLSTPLDRVRTVDVTASLIHRVLGLATVRIGTGTASTDSDEQLDLDGLPAERARGLRAELLHVAPVGGPTGAEELPVARPEEEVVLRFDPGWARFAPLTGSGAVIAAGLVGGGAQLLSELGAFSDVDTRNWSLDLPVWVALAAGTLVLLVGVGVLAVAGYLVTNWDFRLSHAPGSWHLSRGLLTTRETSIDDERLAGVTVADPLTLRAVGASRLSAIVTGLGSEASSSVLAPPAPRDVVAGVASRVLGTAVPGSCDLTGHGAAAARRRYVRAVVPALAVLALVVVVVLLAGWSWWLLLLPAVGVAGAVPLAADRVRSLGHALADGYVVARSGSLNRRREALDVDHVIGWTFRSTWFQRRAGLTTMVATTAGGWTRVAQATCSPWRAPAAPRACISPRVSECASDSPPFSKPTPLSRTTASTTASRSSVTSPRSQAPRAATPCSAMTLYAASAIARPIRSGRVPSMVVPVPCQQPRASNRFEIASPMPARSSAVGASATRAVSTTTRCGLAARVSTATIRCASSYMAIALLVGLSLDATVGTVTTGRPSRNATALPASSDLPPPRPTTTSVPGGAAVASASAAPAVISPPSSSRVAAIPAARRVSPTRSPRRRRT